MSERLIEKLDRLAGEAGIAEITPEIRRFAMLVRQDVVASWPEEKNAAIVVPKEESLWPVQVSIEEFMMRAEQDPDLVGRPVIWTQWPKEAKPPKS